MWGLIFKKLINNNDNGQEISFFDVKELYDAAYAEKAKARVNLKRFTSLIHKAIKMDKAYRLQLVLAQNVKYGRVA